MKLTKRTVAAVVPDPLRDVYMWDEEVPDSACELNQAACVLSSPNIAMRAG